MKENLYTVHVNQQDHEHTMAVGVVSVMLGEQVAASGLDQREETYVVGPDEDRGKLVLATFKDLVEQYPDNDYSDWAALAKTMQGEE